jgi:hypothetical protein
VFIEHPPKNSIASFSFICVANSLGGFNSHLANFREPEASSSTQSSDFDKFIDNLDELLLPDLALQNEKISVFNATSIRDALEQVELDTNQSEGTTQSKSLSDLKEDLDLLLKFKDVGATACRGPPVFDIYSDSNEEYCSLSTTPSSQSRDGLGDEGATARRVAPTLENHSQPDGHTESFLGSHLGLTITSTPQGHFVYWKGFEPSELLNYKSRLVAFMQKLPFQEGKPLSPIAKEGESRQSYSSTALRLTTSRIIKFACPPFATRKMTGWTPSTTTSNSRTS